MIIITGPTASGKTGKAVAVARAIGGEIVSADSRQVYRGMDLGTGKDLDEYGNVPYHMIDICDAGYRYNLHEYLRDFAQAEADIVGRNREVVVCGGTGLYVESIAKGIVLPPVPKNIELRKELENKSIDELAEILAGYKTLHNTTDVDNPRRAIRAIEIASYYQCHPEAMQATQPHPRNDCVVIGVQIDRDTRRQRITQRLKARLDAGMIDEVRRLLMGGVSPDDLIYYGLEYKYVTLHVIGKLTFHEMFTRLETAIHQFAKRQMTWFRGMERRGTCIHWLPFDMPEADFVAAVKELS